MSFVKSLSLIHKRRY